MLADMTTSKQIEDFFDHYALRFNEVLQGKSHDVKVTTQDFADCFIAANSSGVICGKNDREFEAVLTKGYEFYRNIGITSMDIISKEITMLDDFHAMSRISWRSSYSRKKSMGTMEFDVIYLIQIQGIEIKIFAYITGDEQKIFKEKGLI